MIIQREKDAEIVEAGSAAMADYNRAVILYENHVLTKHDFIKISDTITQIFVAAVEGIKLGDNND